MRVGIERSRRGGGLVAAQRSTGAARRLAAPLLTCAAALSGVLPSARAATEPERPASGRVLVAAAANLGILVDRLAAGIADRGIELAPSLASSGLLYAQIASGAPFEVFLSADAERPRRLERERLGVAGTRFAYAVGRLALWSPTWTEPPPSLEAALGGSFRHLAIASPEAAPYGAAAREALQALGLWDFLQDRIVLGENIGQTLQFIATGNAELGFVALSQVGDGAAGGAYVTVARNLHAPIVQEAILLRKGESNPAARAFLEWLQSGEARAVIAGSGYDVP